MSEGIIGGRAPVIQGWSKYTERAAPLLIVIALIILWDASTRFGWVNPRSISNPAAVASLVWEWLVSGFIFRHFGITLFEVAVGYVLGTLFGMFLAFMFHLFPVVERVLQTPVALLNAIPRTILAPFMVLLFGFGVLPKILLVVLVVFIITLMNLIAGLREVDPAVVNNARVMGGSRADLIRYVYTPASLVWIVTAMRISVGHAFTAAIVCELVGSQEGLGWIIATGQTALKADWVMAGLFYASVIVVAIDRFVLSPLERKGAHWRVF